MRTNEEEINCLLLSYSLICLQLLVLPVTSFLLRILFNINVNTLNNKCRLLSRIHKFSNNFFFVVPVLVRSLGQTWAGNYQTLLRWLVKKIYMHFSFVQIRKSNFSFETYRKMRGNATLHILNAYVSAMQCSHCTLHIFMRVCSFNRKE